MYTSKHLLLLGVMSLISILAMLRRQNVYQEHTRYHEVYLHIPLFCISNDYIMFMRLTKIKKISLYDAKKRLI